ncbi:biotin/lipoyl-containing protein [Mycobacterium sp. NPDC003449]
MTATTDVTNVEMPTLGEAVTEATITRWLKAVGDEVQHDEPLLEVATDKVDTEVVSPATGILAQIIEPEDAVVEIGAAIAVISAGDAAHSGFGPGARDQSPHLTSRTVARHRRHYSARRVSPAAVVAAGRRRD